MDNSVRFTPKSKQTREIKQNTLKKSSPKNQTKNISQKNQKKNLKLWQHKDLVSSNEL